MNQDFQFVARTLTRPVVFDDRSLYNSLYVRRAGLEYCCLGKPTVHWSIGAVCGPLCYVLCSLFKDETMALLKALATPVVWVLILLISGLVLTKLKRRKHLPKIGWWAVLAGTVMLVAFSLNPVAHILAYSLECRYRPPSDDTLQTLDIVVLLGGGRHPAGWLRPQAEPSGVSYARACQGVKVFQQSSAGLLVFCGGRPWPGAASEAELMKAVAVDMGVPEDQILTESESQNTRANAARLAALLPAGRGRRLGLVTSAAHMLRSEKAFGDCLPEDTIIPVPVNYMCGPVILELETFLPSAGHLEDSTAAIHEWIGLLWYSLRYR